MVWLHGAVWWTQNAMNFPLLASGKSQLIQSNNIYTFFIEVGIRCSDFHRFVGIRISSASSSGFFDKRLIMIIICFEENVFEENNVFVLEAAIERRCSSRSNLLVFWCFWHLKKDLEERGKNTGNGMSCRPPTSLYVTFDLTKEAIKPTPLLLCFILSKKRADEYNIHRVFPFFYEANGLVFC